MMRNPTTLTTQLTITQLQMMPKLKTVMLSMIVTLKLRTRMPLNLPINLRKQRKTKLTIAMMTLKLLVK